VHSLPTLSTFSIDKPMTFIVDDTTRKRRCVCARIHPFIYFIVCILYDIVENIINPNKFALSSRLEFPLLFKVEKGRERKEKKRKKQHVEDIVNKVRGPANKKIAFLKEVERTGGAPRTSVRTV